ncbi:MAG: hypothetical protein R2799_05560 [Crocinitomicaceae bacterium]
MKLLKQVLKYWKTIVISTEIVLMIYFASGIVSNDGVSGTNFISTIVFLSALLNTFFLIIFLQYSDGTFILLNKIGRFLSIINFIYTTMVFSDTLSVSVHWIPAFMSSLFMAGLALQFYIGLGSLSRLKYAWLFRINSFIIILITFYGIFLLLLKTEQGKFFDIFYYGIALVFLLSLISNLINFKSHHQVVKN